jgi:hypothetical protein
MRPVFCLVGVSDPDRVAAENNREYQVQIVVYDGIRRVMTRETEAIEPVSLEWLGDKVAVEDDASGHVPRRVGSRAATRLVTQPLLRHLLASSSPASPLSAEHQICLAAPEGWHT